MSIQLLEVFFDLLREDLSALLHQLFEFGDALVGVLSFGLLNREFVVLLPMTYPPPELIAAATMIMYALLLTNKAEADRCRVDGFRYHR